VLGHFAYAVDALGNRVSAYEALPRPGSGQTTIASADAAVDYYRGSWTTSGALKVSEEISAGLRIAFFGDEATLTLGVGPEYGICDVYVNGMLWRGFDNYAASAGEEAISLVLQGDGPHILEVKNRAEQNRSSSGYKVAFKQLVVEREYDLQTIQYGYDGLSRLQSADYYAGDNVGGTAFRQYAYTYDLAGNRTQEVVTVNGTPTTANYTYNAANQISNTGFVYDDAGRMTSDGVNTYTWDRASRLLSMGGIAYAYDGLGTRISQTVNSIVTEYLNDVQPGLVKVLAQTAQGNTIRYIHGPRGIQGVEDSVGGWTFPVQDGLGSVRDDALSYSPYGVPDVPLTGFAFTGEMHDANGLQYHRARYYAPELGVWASLDPVEGVTRRAMSLNGYSWVEGNAPNLGDSSGLLPCDEFPPGPHRDFCLEKIRLRLQLMQAGAGFRSMWPGQGGLHMASYLLSHYLSGSGITLWLIPSNFTFTDRTYDRISEEVWQALQAAPEFDLYRIGVCNCNPDIQQATTFQANAFFNKSGLTEGGGLYYGYGGGGFSARATIPSTVLGNWESSCSLRIVAQTQVELYDKYDWCFGNDYCETRNDFHAAEQPGGPIYVGEFFALEEAGWAAQFDWYSGWIVETTFMITCNGGIAELQLVQSTRVDLPASAKSTGLIPRPFIPLSESGYQWQIPPNPDEMYDIDDW